MIAFRYADGTVYSGGCILGVPDLKSCGHDSAGTDFQGLQGCASACTVINDPLVSAGIKVDLEWCG